VQKPPFPRQIDSTAHKDLDACAYKFYLSTIRKLTKTGATNTHLHFGGCLAHGLEIYRKSFYTPGTETSGKADIALALATKSIIHEWGNYIPSENEPISAQQKTLENCILALDGYFKEYPPHEDIIQPKIVNNEPTVEFNFAVPFPDIEHPEGGPVIYTGRFDMLGTYGGADFIDDEKTTYQLGQSWANQWKRAGQITGYCWSAASYGHNIQGAFIRGLGIQKSGIKHMMVIEHRPEWMVKEWLDIVQTNISRAIAIWKEDNGDGAIWRSHRSVGNACSEYGGCSYLSPCTWEDPEPDLEISYTLNTWDPLDKGQK